MGKEIIKNIPDRVQPYEFRAGNDNYKIIYSTLAERKTAFEHAAECSSLGHAYARRDARQREETVKENLQKAQETTDFDLWEKQLNQGS